MAEKEEKPKKTNRREGIPMSEESRKEYEKAWQDMEDCFNKLNKETVNDH